MLNFIIWLFVGWPGVLATIALSVIGLLRNNYRFLVAAAILAFPFAWFVSGFPMPQSPIYLIPVLLFGAGFALYRGHEMIAWLLAIPYFLVVLFLYYSTLAS